MRMVIIFSSLVGNFMQVPSAQTYVLKNGYGSNKKQNENWLIF